MSVSWPATLPQRPLLEGTSGTYQSGVIRTETGVGPAKTRLRYTAVSTRYRVRYILSSSQMATFDTFYKTTSRDGSEIIDYPDPLTGSTVSARIVEPPTFSRKGTYYEVTFEIEILP